MLKKSTWTKTDDVVLAKKSIFSLKLFENCIKGVK